MTIALVAGDVVFMGRHSVQNSKSSRSKIRTKLVHSLVLVWAAISVLALGCTAPPKNVPAHSEYNKKIFRGLKAQAVVSECLQPHTAFGVPPQPVPGIPIMVLRHAECLDVPNVVVTIWPGGPTRVNTLYATLVVEAFVEHLKESNEHFDAELVDVSYVVIADDPVGSEALGTSAAVFKLTHTSKKVSENIKKK